MSLGKAPPYVRQQDSLDLLAPLFRLAVERVVAGMAARGHRCKVFETLRTHERQVYLYGQGRTYPGKIVTNSQDERYTWHGYGLAVDVVEDDKTPWDATPTFWHDLGALAEANGLTWGGRWKLLDLPHLQWGKCRRSPSDDGRALLAQGGPPAVWKVVKAV